MKEHKLIWIEVGYKTVAMNGFENLKIEKLSKSIGISKSSFYHLFIDLENYILHLLQYHMEKCHSLAENESKARFIDPDLIDILIDYKLDLMFNRQIRIHRDNPKFTESLIMIDEMVSIPFINVWKTDLDLKLDQAKLNGLFSLALENFFLQISFENLEKKWLTNYFSNLKSLIQSIVL